MKIIGYYTELNGELTGDAECPGCHNESCGNDSNCDCYPIFTAGESSDSTVFCYSCGTIIPVRLTEYGAGELYDMLANADRFTAAMEAAQVTYAQELDEVAELIAAEGIAERRATSYANRYSLPL